MTRGVLKQGRELVKEEKNDQAQLGGAQARVCDKKNENMENGKKVVRRVLNPRPLGYQHAALPLGWLYIR